MKARPQTKKGNVKTNRTTATKTTNNMKQGETEREKETCLMALTSTEIHVVRGGASPDSVVLISEYYKNL